MANRKIEIDSKKAGQGLASLAMAIIVLIHELMKKQALRRMENNSLSDIEIENLGSAFCAQAEEIERLKKEFELSDEDINIDLGPLGKLI